MAGGKENTRNLAETPAVALPPGLAAKLSLELDELKRKEQEFAKQEEEFVRRETLLSVRTRALNDLTFFAEHIMGFKDLYPPLHSWLANEISCEDNDRILVLIPRGHFKTTIISICYPVWLLCRNPNERIILASSIGDKAEENLAEIISRVGRTEFQAIFGDTIGHPNQWEPRRQDQVTIVRDGGSITGASIRCLGVDSAEVGRHCSVMIIDDMVGKEQINTATQREKAWNWFGRQLSVLDPGSRLVVVGTRWHEDDPYNRISELPGWKTAIRKIKEPWPDGEFIFPTRFNEKVLAELKEIQDDYTFSCFYLNEPVGEGTNPFDINRFRWIEYPNDDIESEVWTHILVDPAVTMEEYSCPSGIIIADAVVMNGRQTLVVTEAILQKMFPDKLVDIIFQLVSKHRARSVAIEAEAQQKTFHCWVRNEMTRRKAFFDIREVKSPRHVKKHARLLGLQPFIHNGNIVFKRDMPGKEYIIEQFSKYPKARYDDVLVALSFATAAVDYPPKHYRQKTEGPIPIRSRLLTEMCKRGMRRDRKGLLDRIDVQGAKAWSRFQRRNGGRSGTR